MGHQSYFRKIVLSLSLLGFTIPNAMGGETDSLPFVVLMSIVSGSYSTAKEGKSGFIDYAEANFISFVSSEFLNYTLKAGKPNGGEYGFPSTHTAVAASNASLMGFKYGWQWGLGLSLITAGVAAEQFIHKKADVWDIGGGAALGVLSGFIATRSFSKKYQPFIPTVLPEKKGFSLNFKYAF